VASKTTKDTQGVGVMTLKKGHMLVKVEDYTEGRFTKPSRYRTKTLPSAGATLAADDAAEQIKMET
jgi:DNA gyrase subunit A